MVADRGRIARRQTKQARDKLVRLPHPIPEEDEISSGTVPSCPSKGKGAERNAGRERTAGKAAGPSSGTSAAAKASAAVGGSSASSSSASSSSRAVSIPPPGLAPDGSQPQFREASDAWMEMTCKMLASLIEEYNQGRLSREDELANLARLSAEVCASLEMLKNQCRARVVELGTGETLGETVECPAT